MAATKGMRHPRGHGHGHGHGEESPSGASFNPGKGVIVTDETRNILGIEVADLTDHQVPNRIPLTVQVFGGRHRHLSDSEDHTGCDVHGSGFISVDSAAVVKPGQSVELFQGTNATLGGLVLTVQRAIALGESEIVIGVSNAMAALRPGEFVPARILLPRDEAVPAIPESALLRTSEGNFVYAVNGDAYFRTAVKVGSEADGWVEITDGLYEGDRVVTRPVQTLWLIELRATKGGGHSH